MEFGITVEAGLAVMILWIPVLIYAVLALGCALVLRFAEGADVAGQRVGRLPNVAVIVAARNEAETIAACLSALSRQVYDGYFEVVVVDDHSTDATAAVAASFAANDRRVRFLKAPAGLEGKAMALAAGADATRADIIVTTDADCHPPPTWLHGIVSRVRAKRADVLCGVTVVDGETLTAEVQRLDWLLLFGVAGAASLVGLPITGMGNNMAVTREALDRIGGFAALADTPTEDYELFRRVNALKGFRSRLDPDADLLNVTLPEPSLGAAIAQRKRWARGGLASRAWVRILYAIIWLAHVAPLVLLWLAPAAAGATLALLAISVVLVIVTTAKRVHQSVPWKAVPAFLAYFGAYIVVMPFALLFRPGLTWKGRDL